MRLLRPKPDHRRVWTTQRQPCAGWGTKGAQTNGDPPAWKPPSLQPAWHGAFPTPTLAAAPSPCLPSPLGRKPNAHNGEAGDGGCVCVCVCVCLDHTEQQLRACMSTWGCGVQGYSKSPPTPQTCPETANCQQDKVLPAPSQQPSLGTQAAGKPGTAPPTPASGYPFGSDPRPGLSQTVPRPNPPHPSTP